MSELDNKINQHFAWPRRPQGPGQGGQGQRHRAVLRAGVPARQYAASDDEATIQAASRRSGRSSPTTTSTGTSPNWSSRRSRRKGRHKIIDKVTVTLNDKARRLRGRVRQPRHQGGASSSRPRSRPTRSCSSAACGASATSSTSTATTARRAVDLGSHQADPAVQLRLRRLPRRAREFTTDEWIDLLIQSIGFNPELFGRRAKLIQLVRLIPFVERNYNLVELGPEGHRQVAHLLGVLAPRHADLRRRGHRPQALRQQLQRHASAWSATGTSSPSTSSPARRSAPTRRSSTS